MTDKAVKGKDAEEKAAEYLKELGFTILQTNYRAGKIGEIDIITLKDGIISFVEVRSGSKNIYGGPAYSINKRKQGKIRKIANCYITSAIDVNLKNSSFRFDTILVTSGGMEYIEDCFR